MYGLDLATYHPPYLADHWLQKIAAERPEEVAERTREVRAWLILHGPQDEVIEDSDDAHE